MRFTYYYKTGDNVRHEGEIDAPGRDAAFAALRAQGIRPIKVVAEARGRRWPWALPALAAVLALGGVWWWASRPEDAPYQVMTPQGPVTLSVARPLPRQRIPGDRTRIEQFPTNLFRYAAERQLARFAEPGRPPPPPDPHAFEGELAECLDAPVHVSSSDFTEHVDLKRIVAGMKREMRAYLAGGGTAEGYAAELLRRQRLEASYRDRARERLEAMTAAAKGAEGPLREAYAYWLRANDRLQSMGIYPLALPDALRPCQAALELE